MRVRNGTARLSPGRNSRQRESITREIQFQSCSLARLKGPLLPMPIHSVRLGLSDCCCCCCCCSSTLKLQEATQSFSSPLLKQRPSDSSEALHGRSLEFASPLSDDD
ncbi:hypothetical protein AOLI_G00150230 [Acnodon oligacanthus]